MATRPLDGKPNRIRGTRAAKARIAPKPRGERSTRRKSVAADATPYHHGALHEALLKAAETVLERDGLQGLTLRAVAREAGGVPMPPRLHHFGDLVGLISELAAIGFLRDFNAAMSYCAADRRDRRRPAGRGRGPMSPMRGPIPACTG